MLIIEWLSKKTMRFDLWRRSNKFRLKQMINVHGLSAVWSVIIEGFLQLSLMLQDEFSENRMKCLFGKEKRKAKAWMQIAPA